MRQISLYVKKMFQKVDLVNQHIKLTSQTQWSIIFATYHAVSKAGQWKKRGMTKFLRLNIKDPAWSEWTSPMVFPTGKYSIQPFIRYKNQNIAMSAFQVGKFKIEYECVTLTGALQVLWLYNASELVSQFTWQCTHFLETRQDFRILAKRQC